jgi:hypothetical protein
MVYLPPFVISGTFAMTNENEIAGFAALYRRVVESLRDGGFNVAEFGRVTYLNEIIQESGDRIQESGASSGSV